MKDLTALERARRLWTLELIPGSELPSVAAHALLEGCDSPSLRELAGLTSGELDQASVLFRRSLEEQGLRLLTKSEALRQLSYQVSVEILDGEIDPYSGARLLWKAAVDNDVDHGHELDPFIYAASEYEDRPTDREVFERAIIEEAREVVRRGL
jgi:hypothetical protein